MLHYKELSYQENIEDLKKFLSSETGLATVSTVQKDGRVLSSIVNCGVIAQLAIRIATGSQESSIHFQEKAMCLEVVKFIIHQLLIHLFFVVW